MKNLLSLSALSTIVLVGCNLNQEPQNTQTVTQSLYADTLVISPNDKRQYKTLTLDNGIDVLLVSDPKVEKSAASLSVGVGLLHDPMTQQGMAHYLEHMLFLGTERYPDSKGYTEFMSKNGGAHNAYTWLDITNYMFKVNNTAYDEALDRFSDFFKSPKLYPEYTEKEKSAVNAEWSMRREMDFFGQFKLARNMMGNHPANRFLIGNLETLGDKENSSLHKETVDFYNKYYSANIMKLAMISNEPLSQMVTKAKKHFSNIKNKNVAKPVVTENVDFATLAKKKVHYVPNEDVKQLKIEFIISNNSSQFAVKPNYFITYLLSNEMAGSPAQVLKAQGLISQLTASAAPKMYGNYGTLSVDIDLTDKGMQNRELITQTVMQYIELIKQNGVDSKYFNEIKTSLQNRFTFLEKGDEFGYVSNLADSMQNYPVNHAINANYHYAYFDKAAINSVLEQLNENQLRVWYISKQEPSDSQLHFYDGKYKITDINDAEIASWKQPTKLALELPTVNKLLPESFAIKTDKTTLENGVQQVYKNNAVTIWHSASQRFSHQPKGLLKVYINASSPLKSAKESVALSLWADLYQINKAKLHTEASVAGMGARLEATTGLMLTLSGFTDKQPELLKQSLLGLKVTPTQLSFEQAVDRFKRGLRNEEKQFPYAQAFSAYTQIVGEGHFDKDELIKEVSNMSVAQFTDIQNKILQNNQIRVFSYGNYDEADFKNIAKEINLALPKERTASKYVYAKKWLPKTGQTIVWQQDLDVADVAVIDVHVNPEAGYKAKAQALILKTHLSTQVFDKLRTEEQLAYAVGATSTSIGEYSGLAFFIQTPVKDPQSMQQRFEEFKVEYVNMLNGIDENTFNQLKASTLVALKEEPKNLSEELSPLLADWYQEKFAYDSKQKLIDEVEQVTLEDLKAYYQTTVFNKNAPRLNIQLRGSKFKDKPFANFDKQIKVDSLKQLKELIHFK